MTTAVSILPLESNVSRMSAVSLLERISTSTVGMVVLDPPARYGIAAPVYDVDDSAGDWSAADEALVSFIPLAKQVARVLVPGGVAVMIGDFPGTVAWDISATWEGLRRSAGVTVLWDTELPPSRHGGSSLSTAVRWYVKPGLRTREVSQVVVPSNVLVCHEVPMADRYHPAQRPVELFNYLITMLTEPGDVVVDPFCGSGSALVAAEMVGRRWIGGDIDAGQCCYALLRVKHIEIEEAHLQPLAWWVRRRQVSIEEE